MNFINSSVVFSTCPVFIAFLLVAIKYQFLYTSENNLRIAVPFHVYYSMDNPKMSRIVRNPDFCLGENKGADQLRGNREADQRLCFRYSDSTIPLLLKSEISSF